jgi:NAD(P)-dependent dehydrogenase (short-subunit alcohol dehydrogenase family)
MNFGLEGRQVVVVGGNRGIGLEIAKGFQDQGCHVTVTSEHTSVMDARDELNGRMGPKVQALQFDITDRSEVSAAFGQLGHIDVLINNSGVFWETPSDDRSDRNYDVFVKQMMINVVGTWWCALAAVPHMQDGGRIIFTSSISGRLGSPKHAGYAATKHGVLGMVKSLAKDLGPLGISVNAVCPGSSATDTNLSSLPPERQKLAVANMALHPGLLNPADHVGSYLFLSSAAAAHITGQTITVDRGQTCLP